MISFDDVENLVTRYASAGIRPGLERIERLLSLMHSPHAAYPAVHVVGTNGKGSTCAFVASVLQKSGYKTAMYTSPHLENPNERLLVNGIPLSAERWFAAVENAVNCIEGDAQLKSDPPSYFELITAVAFLLMQEESIDIAVVEAGLGGRLDATNLLADVVCSAIASISMDHMNFLGDSLEKIAAEKFAVVRPDVPACYLGDNDSLYGLFRDFCHHAGARPFIVAKDAKVNTVVVTDQGCCFDFAMSGLVLKKVYIDKVGLYQIRNASLALAVIAHLMKNFGNISENSIRTGLKQTTWPGRCEIIARHPLVMLDGGHNPDGVEKLVETVQQLWPHKKIGIVYAAMKDKDYQTCLQHLSQLHPSFFATCVPAMERSLVAADLVAAAQSDDLKNLWRNSVEAFEDPLAAVSAALRENEVVIVCGSLYLIGWIRPRIMKRINDEGF